MDALYTSSISEVDKEKKELQLRFSHPSATSPVLFAQDSITNQQIASIFKSHSLLDSRQLLRQ